MLLIAGCNGHVGKEIVRKCIARKIPARCFDIKPLELPGEDTSSLEIISGDVTKLDDVRKAVKGVDVVMDVIGMRGETKVLTHEMVEHGGMKNIIQAAKESQVKHILYTSVMGVEPNSPAMSLSAKWNTEQTLINSGITYTIFRPSGYFVDFAEYFAPQIKKTGAFTVVGDGSTKLQPLDPVDLAEAFIQSTGNEKVKNKIVKIAGPEVFTLAGIIALVGTVVGREAKIKKMPFWLANLMFSAIALVTGKKGGKDFLYRMRRDSVCTIEEMQQIKDAFNIEFKKLGPWLRERVKG
jgi:uncharacterized protein YbjT (DUF2867 family)